MDSSCVGKVRNPDSVTEISFEELLVTSFSAEPNRRRPYDKSSLANCVPAHWYGTTVR